MPSDLPQLTVVRSIVEAIDNGAVEAVGPWGSAKPLVALQTAAAIERPLLYVTSGRIASEAAHDDLCTFAGEGAAFLFPAWEVLPNDTMPPADDIVAERMNTLEHLAAALEERTVRSVVVPVRAFLQCVIPRERLVAQTLSLDVGAEYDFETLRDRLVAMGYVRELMVEQRGEMSIRGGILDIFPISSELPYRLEFFGDEVESIRRFEPETQRSVDRVKSVRILPRSEKQLLGVQADGASAQATITDYLPSTALIVLDEPMAIREEADTIENEAQGSRFFVSWHEADKRIAAHPRLSLAQVAHTHAKDTQRITTPMASLQGWAGNTGGFWDQLKTWDRKGYAVRILCNNTGERRRLLELLDEQGYRLDRDSFDLRVDLGRLQAGFVSIKDNLAVLSEREVFGRRYIRRVRRRFEAGEAITAFSDLKSGDYVVHIDHGIGRYLGLRQFTGKAGDFMAIQYAGGDRIY
ncbi:MAG TPA: hypothetical protein ENN80_06550, partial [Candidatus Hydrogenedentes bacterium]|nr:hypothetical protein [Candidatus Hydrogenedentota bacterium]